MRRGLVIAVVVVGAPACERVLGLTSPELPGEAGLPPLVDGPPPPPDCAPGMFGASSLDRVLFNSESTSAFTVNYDGTVFVAEDASGAQNAVFRRDATGSRNEMIPPSTPGDELAEPTMDPEANILYVRDKTASDTIVGYVRANDVFQPSTALDLLNGKRAGNQTLDLGGSRRMVVQYPDNTVQFVFIEYTGSPLAGWTMVHTYQPADLLGAGATYMVDPSLDANGHNLVFATQSAAYVSHRDDVGQLFPQATQLMAGEFSSPNLTNNCRTLYIVDKPNQLAHRYQNP